MRRRSILLLNLAISLSLAFSGILSEVLISTPAAMGISGAPAAAPDAPRPHLASRQVKRERKHDRKVKERRHNDRASDRKRDRKQDRRHERKRTSGSVAETPSSPPGQLNIENSYIVILEDSTADAETVASELAAEGVTPTHVYDHVLNGFSAVLTDDQLDTLRDDPQVRDVVPDREVYAFQQTLPTGIARIGTVVNPTAKIDGTDERVDADVAVLDTGIASHSDLNLVGGVSCITEEASYADGNGHGTHVAGTIGALDNGFGVVGVAPGARLWAVKVLNSQGSGSWSSVICGLNWVAANSGTIDVANMSLGGSGRDSTCFAGDPLHDAICQVVNAGTPVVVAAGNGDNLGRPMDAANVVPAAYDEVITVSALADSDGLAGGLGPQTSRGPDDSLATFSNFGADVDIAAPGVSILSTVRGGNYAKFSGTSMASPHVAGAVALYRATYPSATPAQVKTALLSTREAIALPNDPDGINEGVLNVAGSALAPLPTVDSASSSAESAVPATIEKKKDKKKSKNKKGKGAKGNNKSKKKKR